MTIYYVADHDIHDYPGGAEKVDYNIYTALGYQLKKLSNSAININSKDTYLIGNATLLTESNKNDLAYYGNYCIFEHDYKMHPTRQPHRYPGGVFPKNELINLFFYKQAKAVFLQTKDHLDGFQANNVEGNLISLSTSIWSKEELDLLLYLTTPIKKHREFCIIGNNTPDKGADISIAICQQNSIDYVRLPSLPLFDFYKELVKYPALVYHPRVRESFCRLVVEARCLQMNVITTKNYGAVCEPWFYRSGPDLIEFLRERTAANLDIIKSFL